MPRSKNLDWKLVFFMSVLVSMLALVGAVPLAGQHTLTGPVAVAWENHFSTGVDSQPRALAVSPDGRSVFVAVQVGFSSSQCRVSAHDAATGAELWMVMTSGPSDCLPWKLAVSSRGVLYVASLTRTADAFVPATLLEAYSAATGTRLWSVVYDGPGDSGFSVIDLALSPDASRLYLAGGRGDWSLSGSRVVSFNAGTGGLLWETVYPVLSIYGEQASALALSPDGQRVYVTGGLQSGDDKNDFLTLAFHAATGTQLWEARSEGPPESRNHAVDVVVSPDGRKVFVTGGSFQHGTGYNAATAAYDAATGTELWLVLQNGPANDFDNSVELALSRDGRTVFVAGTSTSPDSNRDFAVFAYDAATGGERWRTLTDRGGAEQAVALVSSLDGRVLYVTGYTYPSPVNGDYDPDFLTLAYATGTGAEIWSARYQGTGSQEDQPVALALSPAGDALFVTGSSQTTANYSSVTLAYRVRSAPPAAGRVRITGGGWFDSPAGALPTRPPLTGKAHLKLNVELRDPGAAPEGQMSFRFGPLDFSSTSLDLLNVAGNRATAQGRGTLRGAAGEHRFLVSVVDEPPGHRGGGDRVRVKIWTATTGEVLYDSQPGAAHDALPTTLLEGGEITIHR